MKRWIAVITLMLQWPMWSMAQNSVDLTTLDLEDLMKLLDQLQIDWKFSSDECHIVDAFIHAMAVHQQ